jgi:hypothetical protein
LDMHVSRIPCSYNFLKISCLLIFLWLFLSCKENQCGIDRDLFSQ